jgi:hypothetical protein
MENEEADQSSSSKRPKLNVPPAAAAAEEEQPKAPHTTAPGDADTQQNYRKSGVCQTRYANIFGRRALHDHAASPNDLRQQSRPKAPSEGICNVGCDTSGSAGRDHGAGGKPVDKQEIGSEAVALSELHRIYLDYYIIKINLTSTSLLVYW